MEKAKNHDPSLTPHNWRGSPLMPLFVIVALAVLNLTITLLALQPALAARRDTLSNEMREAALTELNLAKEVVKLAPDRQAMQASITEAINKSADPDACLAITSKDGRLVAGQARCKDYQAVTKDTWQALIPENAKQTRFYESVAGNYRFVVSRNLIDKDFNTNLIYVLVVLGVFVATIGQFLLWLALNRIHLSRISGIASSARRMSAGDLHERVPTLGRHDSYLILANALNDMAERFQTQSEATRIANNAAAHDLRMPLSRVLNSLQRIMNHRNLSAPIAAMVEQSQEEVERAMSQFSALNTLARLETGAALDTMEVVDLAKIVTTACELFDPVLEDAGILLEVKSVSIQARVQVQLLTQALANLLQNAEKYAGAGALVRVTCTRVGDFAEIVVADNGPGIPEGDLQRVTERYVRLDPSRSTEGFGLGLSMVVAVAKLHGGSLSLVNDHGLKCTMRLPVDR